MAPPELAVGGLVDFVDGADVGMVQGRGRPGLLEEPLLGRLVAGQLGREELQRDQSLEPGVLRLVDLPHPASADERDDLVLAEPRTGGDGHRGKVGLYRLPPFDR